MGLDDTWAQAPSLSKIATIFARTFALMGKCRFPLYISQSLAGERFDIWRMINERRMTRYEWSFAGSEAEQKSSHPSIIIPIDCWKKPGASSSSLSASEASDHPGG